METAETCRLCGKRTSLTNEHIPPRAAGNTGNFVVHRPESATGRGGDALIWRSEDRPGSGIAEKTLCETCNNWTGSVYGQHYASFVNQVRPFVSPAAANNDVPITLEGVFPLRIVKQVVSLFLSTSKPVDFSDHTFMAGSLDGVEEVLNSDLELPSLEKQTAIYDQLRTFVLDKHLSALPSDLRILTFGSIGPYALRTGVFVEIDKKTGKRFVGATVGLYPVHWILSIDTNDTRNLLDVTRWATDFLYGQSSRLNVSLPCRWLAGKYPLDFRDPEEIYTGNFLNSMRRNGFSTDKEGQFELEEALAFARSMGVVKPEGYLISAYSEGAYYEFGGPNGLNGWIPDGDESDVRTAIKYRLENHLLY